MPFCGCGAWGPKSDRSSTMGNAAIVITTIFPPNDAIREIARQCSRRGLDFIVAGDAKGPSEFAVEGAAFLDLAAQRAMGRLGEICPPNTYARKNLAYLEAIRRGACYIRETDDDNVPRESFWASPSSRVPGRFVRRPGWVNAYRFFSERFVYPRGYPIDLALADWGNLAMDRADSGDGGFGASSWACLVQQGLADGDPDVDSIYRMTHELPLSFEKREPLILGEGVWCPFNSQNTVFFPEVYPLLYLPATCSFRMTDIWRSFIAQRILWSCGWHLSFHQASVIQHRNPHDLLRDFRDEVPGYLGNRKLVALLERLDLGSGIRHMRANLERCYAALIGEGYFQAREEVLVAAWLSDLPRAAGAPGSL